MKQHSPALIQLRQDCGRFLLLLALWAGTPVSATTHTVTNLNDSGPGSLRNTIATSVGGDSINFSIAGTILLTSGELGVGRDLTIIGPAAGLTVSGNNSSRVFDIVGGTVVISNLVISGGRMVGPNGTGGTLLNPNGGTGGPAQGGSILNSGNLSLINCTLRANAAVGGQGGAALQGGNSGSGGPAYGGAICNFGGLSLLNCTCVSNSVTAGDSGAVSLSGTSGSGGGAYGGALYTTGTVSIVNCTFSGQTAKGGSGRGLDFGGSGGDALGASIYGAGTLSLVNCTFGGCAGIGGNGGSGSFVGGNGGNAAGGDLFQAGAAALRNNILSSGSVVAGVGGSGIVSGASGTATGPEVSGTVTSQGHNLVGKTNASTGWVASDFTGAIAAPLDPLLGLLQNNGGPTFTMALLSGSAAIDAGDDTVLGAPLNLTTDQRGRPRKEGAHVDIGAYETGAAIWEVLNTNDNGPGSLRQILADVSPADVDTVMFAPNVTNTITLTSGELALSSSVNIAGPGVSLLAVSGNNSSTVFDILSGNISISGMTIRNGRAAGSGGNTEQNGFDGRGGGIFNQGALALTGCIIVSNSVVGGQGGPTDSNTAGNGAAGLGGGICSIGSLSLTDCVIGYNMAVGGAGGQAGTGFAGGAGNAEGGGLCSIGSTLSLTRCSFLADTATGGVGGLATVGGSPGNGGQGYGGALYTDGVTTVTNCTFSGSSALAGTGGGGSGSGEGGGIWSDLNLTLFGCTVASNTAAGSSFDFGGGIYDQGTNLLIRCSTITGNRAEYGGGLDSAGSAADLGDTILAGNSIAPGGDGPDGEGTIFSSDYNLIQSTSGATITGTTTHNILGQNPLLGPLQDNGGPAFTMALLPGSPAIDKGKSFGATTDQRGGPRIFDFPVIANAVGGDGSDIGAFELTPLLTPPLLAIAQAGRNVLLSWPATDNGYTLESKASLSPSVLWSPVPGSPPIVAGRFTVTNSSVSGNSFYRLRSP
jgi:hypothetical protein